MVGKFLLLMAAIVATFFIKLDWDEYQQNRAAEQVPQVKEIFHKIQQMRGADAFGDTSISVNEYATALWQSYKANIKCDELRPHFDSEASRQDFRFHGQYEAYSRSTIEYRNGEFEMRVRCQSDGYSFSVNWYGLGR